MRFLCLAAGHLPIVACVGLRQDARIAGPAGRPVHGRDGPTGFSSYTYSGFFLAVQAWLARLITFPSRVFNSCPLMMTP